jgi:hypothetical protein
MGRSAAIFVAGLGLLLTGCAGWHTYPQASSTEVAQNGVHQICHTIAVTGSTIPTRECHSQEEWDRMRETGNDQLNQDSAPSLPRTDPGSANGR